jgi:hypothetical protein
MPSKTRRRPTKPVRDEKTYRKLFIRIETQDDCITYLMVELRALAKRVERLEARHKNPFTHDGMGRPLDKLGQYSSL